LPMKDTILGLLRLSIGKKLLLGFLSYGGLTLGMALFALSSLDQLNAVNYSITQRDIPLIEITDRMVENLLAQELYASRSRILKSPDELALFWKRGEEFKALLGQLKTLPQPEAIPVAALTALYEEYTRFFLLSSDPQKNPPPSGGGYEQQMRGKQEEIFLLLKKTAWAAKQDQVRKTQMVSEIGNRAFRVIAGLCGIGILLGVLVALIMTRNISGPIHQLKMSTKEISEGKFDALPTIRSWDELGDLSNAFKEMAIRLKHLEEMNLDANPLTRLPGGAAIEAKLKDRLKDGGPLAFCLADLRNFKAFNDRYGYVRGNEVLQATADLLRQALREQGRSEDFIGHIGGDDFALITTTDRYEKICNAALSAFDQKIPDFYDPEDRKRGAIQGATRRGEEVSFPLMTLSIAVVTNQHRKLKNHIQVGEIAAEMKNFAKSFTKSIYVVDKRRDPPTGGTA
jgi:GGDEF domain-containing protein